MAFTCREYTSNERGRNGTKAGGKHTEFSGSGSDGSRSRHTINIATRCITFSPSAASHNWSVTTPPRSRFDSEYYDRFYRDAPVHDARRIGFLASGVLGFAGWWDVAIESVLDIGAGPGLWRDWFAANHPDVSYRSTDVSDYACETFRHEKLDITTWKPDRRYDLVVCQGVLHYLSDRAAAQAIATLGAACGGVLYLEAPTLGDRHTVIDTALTDLDVNWRAGDWYRSRLDKHFTAIGAGMFVSRSTGVGFYELERSVSR
jgi:SAM-dependent methyltransferase